MMKSNIRNVHKASKLISVTSQARGNTPNSKEITNYTCCRTPYNHDSFSNLISVQLFILQMHQKILLWHLFSVPNSEGLHEVLFSMGI